ncbi:MAG: hydantoinase B/oxoprolinase family protein [Pseudomonadota bacterium]
MSMNWRVGIDTGGTFTDIVAINGTTGSIRTRKIASTPDNPADAAIAGLLQLDIEPMQIASIVLGTTLATNAAIQRKGARTCYVTTAGFEDIPHLQRADKPDPYDLQWVKPRALVPRRHCFGVRERIGPKGQVLLDLTDDELQSLGDRIEQWRTEGTQSDQDQAVAVNLLFAYANPRHEQVIGDYLAARFPGLALSLSSEVSPLWREYERASTTILDAFTRPLLKRFLENTETLLREHGFIAPLSVMKSNGGQMLAQAAAERPVQFLLSGLAGGVIAGKAYGNAHGFSDLITFDMGGTSTDVAVIVDDALTQTTEYQLEFSLPVSVPSLDVRTIGAGGGSIIWIDKGGLLKVGPQSAGATPGPACYGHGGMAPTVTDANLVLGRLGADSLLGGTMKLDVKAAHDALAPFAARLGQSIEEVASAAIAIANENMANAIRVLTVERGIDQRDFALVAFGGAGPLHGAEVAQILGIDHIIVPSNPGLASALGTLLTAPRVDVQRTYVRQSADLNDQNLRAVLDDMEQTAKTEFHAEGHRDDVEIRRSVAMRYAGQSHELDIPCADNPTDVPMLARLVETFHEQHEASYGYRIADERIEVMGCAVTASGPGTRLPEGEDTVQSSQRGTAKRRLVNFGGQPQEWPVYERLSLAPGVELVGPVVIEGYDAALLMPSGLKGRSAGDRTIIMSGAVDQGIVRSPNEPVSLGIINNALVNICREMGTAMIRTSYSPIFNESRDFSCAIFDRQGQLLAQGEYCPAQLGAIVYTVECLLSELGTRRLEPGDVMIHNDPYRGGCHMPEHLLLKPLYADGELQGYAAIIAHLAEIGGMVVGSFAATATEVFQEGLRLPPVLLMRRGKRVQEVWDIMMANHRTPRHTWGDLNAMLGALHVAEHRYAALVAKYGAAFLCEASCALLDYAERWMRNEINAIPDGVYEFEDALEDDGVQAKPIRMHIKLTVDGETFTADYSSSDDQALGPVNATRGVTISATYNALFQLADNAIPRNGGCYRSVNVTTRKGSCLDVAYPAPSVGGNTETQPRIVFLVLGALSKVIAERISASEGCTACNFLIGGDNAKTGEYFAHYHFEGSGWGGRFDADGNDVQNHIIGNCRITPIEVFETRFPLTILAYGIVPDSGGAGRHRGGLASRRIMLVEAKEMRASLLMDHAQSGPWALQGGHPGKPAKVAIKSAGASAFAPATEVFATQSAAKFADVRLHQGDEICIESCGGAGYGDPHERDSSLLAHDLAEGFVSTEAAVRHYGLNAREIS